MKPKFIKQREYYIRRMQRNGVEATVHAILKPKHSWDEGLTFEILCKEVRRLRDKKVGDSRIRHAISMHNRFGVMYGIYIKSDFGWVGEDKEKSKEWRYFVPKEQEDINREHTKLEHVKDIANLKEGNLSEYEIKTIPQERQLEELKQHN